MHFLFLKIICIKIIIKLYLYIFLDSYVIIENSKPDVTGEATAKTESVYWKKLPLDSSNSENFINPRLKIKVTF